MKTRFLFLLFFVVSYSFSQSVNDYKAVIVPLKYDFLKTENQYRLNTLTKFDLKKAGFEAFYENEVIPTEFNDRCSLLYVDVKKVNAFLITKLFITLSDCQGKIVFQSEMGKSKEKDYGAAYNEALNKAFQFVYDLGYKYNGAAVLVAVAEPVKAAVAKEVNPVVTATPVVSVIDNKVSESVDSGLLYAQPTPTGFQLINSEPKVIMKIYKTSVKDYYTAAKGDVQGVLIAKDNQWFFEYYQNDKLISEKVNVKF
jgi:hypothetical protein